MLSRILRLSRLRWLARLDTALATTTPIREWSSWLVTARSLNSRVAADFPVEYTRLKSTEEVSRLIRGNIQHQAA